MNHSKTHAWADVIFGINAWAWGALRIYHGAGNYTRPDIWGIALLHLIVGGLFIFRSTEHAPANFKTLMGCFPSFILGGLIMKQAEQWGHLNNIVFIIGLAITLTGLLALGRSFAIFPATRNIVGHGLYRWVRHPAYLGELIMIAAAASAWRNLRLALLVWAATLASLVIRIVVEEQHLSADPDSEYIKYKTKVRYRLVPFLW